jgi:Fic family protein
MQSNFHEISDMNKSYLWQDPAFPHFYYNPAVVAPLEEAFKQEINRLDSVLAKVNVDSSDVLTEEVLANSDIDGVKLDRESARSALVNNVTQVTGKELGAVNLMRMAMENYPNKLNHDLIQSMHRETLRGSDSPNSSIGTYVGNMKITDKTLGDDSWALECKVVHEGVSKDLVQEKMTEFIHWYNQCSPSTPLLNAIQSYVHFVNIHPFCDGNGRIGRNLMLMRLCRDLERNSPLALSCVFNRDYQNYYQQFVSGLDITHTIQSLAPLFLKSITETEYILSLTALRTKVLELSNQLNKRQLLALDSMIDDALRDSFMRDMSNSQYKRMNGIGDRTALRDLGELCELGLIEKSGQLKGTRYNLSAPHLNQGH